jgi:hypothetical protein
MAIGPVLARSISTVREKRKSPFGTRTTPMPEAIARSNAAAQSVAPSPTAPNARTSAKAGGTSAVDETGPDEVAGSCATTKFAELREQQAKIVAQTIVPKQALRT